MWIKSINQSNTLKFKGQSDFYQIIYHENQVTAMKLQKYIVYNI